MRLPTTNNLELFSFFETEKTGLDTTQQPYMLYARVVVIKKTSYRIHKS